MSLKKIKLLDVGEGEKVPTLQELLEHTKKGINYMCKIKVKGIIDEVVKIFDDAKMLDSTILISFKHHELLKIRDIYPNLKIGAIIPSKLGWPTNWFMKKQIITKINNNQFYAINLFHRLINKNFIKNAHEKNLRIFPWIINSKKKMEKVI
ncbi:MAG: glycerophosphodiester phosphodiesterase, partial [Promethearchaeota archaeon]